MEVSEKVYTIRKSDLDYILRRALGAGSGEDLNCFHVYDALEHMIKTKNVGVMEISFSVERKNE